MSRRTKGTLIAIVGVLLLSFTAILISRLTGYYRLPPLVLAFWRDFFVSLGLLVGLLITRRRLPRIKRQFVPFFILYGLLLFVFNSIWTYSVPLNGAAVATVLAYGSVGFTVLLARWVFREQISLAKIVAVLFSITGCGLVANAFTASAWNTRPFGIVVGLLTGLLYAFYNLAGKEVAHRKIDTWEAMFFSFGIASLFLLVSNLVPGLPGAAGSMRSLLPQLPPDGWLLLVALALAPTLLGFTLYNMSMNYLPVSVTNLIATLEPVFTAVEAYLLLGERMALVQVGGSLLVIAAVVIVQVSESLRMRSAGGVPVEVPTVDVSL